MKVIFIGDRFYEDSGTIMSPVYEIKEGGIARTDWGFITIALRNGEEVHIRPATKDEMKAFELRLLKINAENAVTA